MPGPLLRRLVERGRQRQDRARVQRRVGPPVEPPADPGRQRIVDRRVTQRARDAEAGELPGAVHPSFHADDSVEPQQFERHRRVLEVDLSGGERRHDRGRQGLDVDLQTDAERG
jgi:hypothetical protein